MQVKAGSKCTPLYVLPSLTLKTYSIPNIYSVILKESLFTNLLMVTMVILFACSGWWGM